MPSGLSGILFTRLRKTVHILAFWEISNFHQVIVIQTSFAIRSLLDVFPLICKPAFVIALRSFKARVKFPIFGEKKRGCVSARKLFRYEIMYNANKS